MPKRWGLILSITFFTFTGCLTSDPEVTVPGYIYVPEFRIDNSQSDIEIFSEKITDVWIYVNNNNQGAYELPALIPIAENGSNNIEIRPGIKNAGISSERRPYPYYEAINLVDFNLRAGKTDTIDAVTFYDSDPKPIVVAWEEGFESLGPTYEINPQSDTIINIINITEYPDLVFKGNRTGYIVLEDPGLRFEMISPTLYNLPRNNIPIYLEINYKSNADYIVGIYINNKSEQFPIYVVKAQESWNKIYLDFSTYVQANPAGSNFNIFIGFTRNPSVEKAEMYLDNIKMIHY